MTPRYAALSKLLRARSRVRFRLQQTHNAHVWNRERAGRGGEGLACIALTWELIDLDEKIREMEYGTPAYTGGN